MAVEVLPGATSATGDGDQALGGQEILMGAAVTPSPMGMMQQGPLEWDGGMQRGPPMWEWETWGGPEWLGVTRGGWPQWHWGTWWEPLEWQGVTQRGSPMWHGETRHRPPMCLGMT